MATGKDIRTFAAMAMTALALASAADGPSQRAEVKLMSYNVMHCEGMDGRIDVARTAARIRMEDPDFACLQEIDWRTARVAGVDEPGELARLTGMHATFARAIFYRGGQYGVMVLSREKPIGVVKLPLPGREPRVLLVCEFKDCVVATSHLSVAGREEREASVPIIRDALARYGKPVFFTGDWNATPESDVLKALGGFLTVVSDQKGRTWHGRSQFGPKGELLDRSPHCIDYIAVDARHASGFEVVDAHVVEDRATSDHAPVVTTLSFPSPALPDPAVVPAPVSMKTTGGQWRAKASVVSDALYKTMVDSSLPREGYRISITGEDGIGVTIADDAGAAHALETLRQIAVFSWGRIAFPCCEIEDWPRFGWRGVHVDESRHFFGKAAIRRILDLMAMHKLNVLHWHLTDNEGWRLPVARHPKLTTVGAARPLSRNHKDLADHFEDGTYGPFAYTRKDIEEIVAYARERFIRVVPEVDVPGHSQALLAAYPELGCFGGNPAAAPADAVKDVVCAGDDRVLAMLKDVLDEVVAMFPDEVVHIGGDEVNKVNWKACPRCQARMKAHGLKTENDLQAWFMGEMAAHLATKGRRVLGWDEIVLDGAAPKGCIVMSWRGAEGGRAAAAIGLQSVMCPHMSCYFDYSQSLQDDPATYPWFTHQLPLSKAYAYDPLDGIPAAQQALILGGQCCNWTEFTCNETELQWKMWPRTCATAEVFWSPASRRDFDDFLRRMITHRRRLIAKGVNCAPLR
ncbi:MAG: family 20 glycosylhydrolase [Kiritimatiellae bacterium]|nr:family 20 glycosylhydrolase [Kiritimatiellia bacterium]